VFLQVGGRQVSDCLQVALDCGTILFVEYLLKALCAHAMMHVTIKLDVILLESVQIHLTNISVISEGWFQLWIVHEGACAWSEVVLPCPPDTGVFPTNSVEKTVSFSRLSTKLDTPGACPPFLSQRPEE
jgi:hypothetical protein